MSVTQKPAAPRVYRQRGAPSFWALMDGPRRTNPGDSGDVADLMGGTAAGVRTGGCTWGNGDRGKCLSFDGSTGYATFGAQRFVGAFTVACRICPASTADMIFLCAGANNLYFRSLSGVLVAKVTAGAAAGTLYTSTFPLTAGKWADAALTYDPGGGTVRLYGNGSPVLSGTGDPGLSTTDTVLLGKYFGGGLFYSGLLDEPRIYSWALSPAEVARESAAPYARLRPPAMSRTFLMGSLAVPRRLTLLGCGS